MKIRKVSIVVKYQLLLYIQLDQLLLLQSSLYQLIERSFILNRLMNETFVGGVLHDLMWMKVTRSCVGVIF